MTKNKGKIRRQSFVPLCYQKRNLSRSNNTSLSQLLNIASYKKRIKELRQNNRQLAAAYNEARCEVAQQGELLQDYARNSNQIMMAQFKLNEMAKTIAKLVTDLEEVRGVLQENRVSAKDFLRPLHDQMKIKKPPQMDQIDELSFVTSEASPEVHVAADISEPMVTSDNKACHNKESPNQPKPDSSESDPILQCLHDDPPLLFSNESEEERRPSKKSKSSKRYSTINQLSLTPELNIDLPSYGNKRSSSRRQTLYITPRLSSSKSNRRSDFDIAFCSDNFTPKRGSLSPKLRALSSAFMLSQQSEEKKGEKFNESSQLPVEDEKVVDSNFVNVNSRGSKNRYNQAPDSLMSSLSVSDLIPPVNPPSSSAVATNNAEYNHTILLGDDMELTEVLRPVTQNIPENSSAARIIRQNNLEVLHTVQQSIPESFSRTFIETMTKPGLNPDVTPNTENDCDNTEIYLTDNLMKTTENSENALIREFTCLNHLQVNNHESVMNKTPESKKRVDCTESLSQSLSSQDCVQTSHKRKPINFDSFSSDEEDFVRSPSQDCVRSSRKRKPVNYDLFFSSDESDSKSSPTECEQNKNKVKKIIRDTAIFIPKTPQKNSEMSQNIKKCIKSPLKEQNVNEKLQQALSVYELDVSNSKKVGKKTQKKSKNKKSQKKDSSKPISQNCTVEKLKGFDYKYSKNENILKNRKENQQLQNCKSLLPSMSTFSSSNMLNEKQASPSWDTAQGNIDNRTNKCEPDNSTGDEKSTPPEANIRNQSCIKTPKSDIKRVSFAPADLVCNFSKMSLCKTIANNKKIHRASKSIAGLEVYPELSALDEIKTPLFETEDALERITDAPLPLEEQFNFSDETEVYTLTLASNTLQSISSPVKNKSPKPIISTNTISAKIHKDHFDTNSKRVISNNLQSFASPVKNTLQKSTVPSDSISANTHDSHRDVNSKKGEPALKNKPRKLSGKENSRKVQPSISGKIPIDVLSLSPHSNPPAAQSKSKSSSKKLSRKNTKENTIQADPQTVDVLSQSSSSANHSLLCPSTQQKSIEDELKTSVRTHNSSVILKDIMNIEGTTEDDDLPKRRSKKVVSYKEPALNKKMRRN